MKSTTELFGRLVKNIGSQFYSIKIPEDRVWLSASYQISKVNNRNGKI
jgi:hypothetical protein